MNKILMSFMIFSVAIISGCASIVNGQNQSISVTSSPVSEVRCSLSNDKGQWFVNSTPGSVTVHRSYKDLKITCEKKGFLTKTISVKSSTKPMAFGNILFGGVIGAGVDMADGSAYDYPVSINIPMKRLR